MRKLFVALSILMMLAVLSSPSAVYAQEGPAPGAGGEGGIAIPGFSGTPSEGQITAPNIQPGETPSIPNIFPTQPQEQLFPVPGAPGTEPGTPGESPLDAAEEFRRFITGSLPEERLTRIERYGASFFRNPPSTFAPADMIPVSPGYIVGPGDQVRISVWGMVEGTWIETVDRQGTITIPRVGVIGVAGMTFDDLKMALEDEFSRYYSNFEMSVTLGALKSMKVYVVGNAKKPGAYTISSLATLVNVLLDAGGPDENGSLRKITVKRGNRVVTTFDMYDLLLKGDKSKDIRMMPEDVIFIPVVGPQAAVIGNVRRPAIYELKGNTTVEALLNMAGGMTPTGSIDRVQMMRVKQKEFRTVFEGDLKDRSINNLKKMQLADGDLIRLFSVVERQSLVRITGPVAKPGDFAIDSGRTTLRDVLGWAGGLLYYAADEVEITRVSVTPAGPKTERLKVNAWRALQGDPVHNVTLRMNDFIFARTVPDWKLYRQVTVYGEVMYPGRYSIEDGETLSSLLQRAGGFSPRAYPRAAIFTRERVRQDQQRQIEEMADRMERELLGISANELSAALTQAESNLLKAEASQKQALVAKLRETKAAGRIATLIAQPEVLKGTAYDIPLEEGDVLYVPSNPTTVQVIGAVLNPTSFVFDKRLSHTQYIRMAGGYSTDASPARTYILKADGTAMRVKASARGETPWVKEFNGGKTVLVEPGDAIVVPVKLSSYRGVRQARDYMDVVYKAAVTAMAIHEVTK